MSKVLVDRELLERCVDRWACCAIVETPGAEQAWLELRAVAKAAQPAEAEGADLQRLAAEFDAAPDDAEWEPPHPIFQMARDLDRVTAALSAVTAERDRLREQCELNDLVHGTKGRERVTALLAQNEELRKDATRLDWLDGYIVIAEHEDTGKFSFNSIKGALRECVDAAMAAKEA
ncbi:hypothetical protein [Stutzerimonas stutzeri]|uniref:hypothetical protein n=1 Tax=Stutzerimonas stutzeri TaxID=316 RepID=UPI0005EBA272|nr:hypothetical protein [Stutzerimonas stutzeri]